MMDARFLELKFDYTKIIKDLTVNPLLVSKSEKAKAIFEAFMMDKNGKPSSCHAGSRSLLVYPQKDYKGWGWHQFVKWSDLETLHATDGLVTIVCGVILLDDDDDPLDAPPSDMGSHLSRLLDCADGSDVSFVVKAHRAVLAARSPVIKAKLLGAMADAKMPSITMHDISAATFKAMLRFMYTDALPADDELGGSPLIKVFQDLLAMADRKLWENMATDNVGSTLACAETYNCPELKRKCIAFVAKDENLKKTVLTDRGGPAVGI
ncbi:hypothetical protein GQ55_6G259400 [Panicum hallii var. hallii]|uniref:BTB domain-containing protein n=1 Tax=Panicum hallii var. hallii TaxID=1504633 RepID=A0A2T7D9N8_9POAL|nr:hypothetical protein GQ55_6G259400 [Panicum hallii var. hallii]